MYMGFKVGIFRISPIVVFGGMDCSDIENLLFSSCFLDEVFLSLSLVWDSITPFSLYILNLSIYIRF